MGGVGEACVVAPATAPVADRFAGAVHRRRAVAVAATAMELLRPASDLARLAESFEQIDVLLASDGVFAASTGPIGVLGLAPRPADGAGHHVDPEDDDVLGSVAELDLPGLCVHRLGLHSPLGPADDADLVAALSELVGFDPEPGLYCLAPAPAPADPACAAVSRAAQRIAQVYGIPLLRYRCLELTVVDEQR